jgi:hypothetical protein
LFAAAVIPGVAQAQSDDIVQLFKDVCLASAARPAEVASSSRAKGFVAPPAAFAKDLQEEFPGGVMFWKLSEGSVVMTVTSEKPFPLDEEVQAPICGVLSLPPFDKTVERDLEASLAMGKPTREKEFAYYLFEERGGKRTAIDPKRMLSLSKAISDGRLQMIMTGGDNEMSMLLLMVPRPK